MAVKVNLKHILPVYSLEEETDLVNLDKLIPEDRALVFVKDGIKVFARNYMYTGVSDYGTFQSSKLAAIKEGPPIFKLPKIPADTFKMVVDFVFLVYDKKKTESNVLCYLKNTKDKVLVPDFKMIVPEQTVYPAKVDYKVPPDDKIPQGYELLVGSIHSHPGFSSFQSGTDSQDEGKLFEGFHITIGQTAANPSFHCRLNICGQFFQVPLKDLVEQGDLPASWFEEKKYEPAQTQIGFHHSGVRSYHHSGWPYDIIEEGGVPNIPGTTEETNICDTYKRKDVKSSPIRLILFKGAENKQLKFTGLIVD